ncbi:MAG: dehydrogenase E1 component subunit alpha/beta [Chitinophagaceae bacterium]|nr:dehydrogenase E1 component subunit alpha/beta [Chitinophagaceae bacterium]MCA6469308.1 dehydrogenase E1 component subunit alpha/beta [Chitinophagaceae bacterium]MCA6491037.1 dehydrogenase E1 component subunit alpha/beta [Chitinophagaceae bacterium]MCA6512567.1 dehydrogenase E1 component subunit alpha/beta [Chitinophagaceae bacterium]
MQFQRNNYSNQELIHLYRQILLPRMIEEKMLVLLRQGKISKWFSGIGQEAIAVGVTAALNKRDWIMPLHRNLGVFTSRDMPLHRLFQQWQGHKEGYSKGRERSFHFGSSDHRICGMISHLGPQLALADGAALAHQLKEEPLVAVAFTGDGGTSEGDFHEALNVAAVWNLPVIFIIENNGYGLSTPVSEQYRCRQLADKGVGYGIETVVIDGNNILAVHDTIRGVREYCLREKKPYLIECMTFRMRGHEEASGTKYVPKELMEEWSRKDPIKNYEQFLVQEGVLTEMEVASIRHEHKAYIDNELQLAEQVQPMIPDTSEEVQDVYAARQSTPVLLPEPDPRDTDIKEKRMLDAIREALEQSMERDPRLVLMGQDIAEYGGAFKVTEGLMARFGKHRVRNTPLCESAIVGVTLGLALEGIPSVMEMQFADFVTVGFNQIVNNLAKIHYRWGQSAPVVIRMPTGAGVGAGPFHSQSNEAWFTHVPGLKVVYPSGAYDAKGLLNAAIQDPNPVMYFEHKVLYRSQSEPVPDAYYEIEIGKARIVQEGEDITVITYGAGVHWAMDYQRSHPEVSLYVVDLRSLLPLDYEAIRLSVAKTGKILVLHEDNLVGGIGGEIAAWISEHCFEMLDAPVLRCASLDTPVPFNVLLEKNYLAESRLDASIQQLLQY